MKTLYLYIPALMTTFAVPALAAGDCILIDKGGCSAVDGKTGAGSAYIDTNDDGIGDSYTADARG